MKDEDFIMRKLNNNPYYSISHIANTDKEDIASFRVRVDKKTGRKRGLGLVQQLRYAALCVEDRCVTRTDIIRDKYTGEIA